MAEQQMSFREELESWHGLVVRERQIHQMISRQEARLVELRDRLSPFGILGAFRSNAVVNGDIRPGGGHGDKIGTMVAETDEKVAAAQLGLAMMQAQLQDVQDAIQCIAGELETFSDRHRVAVELMYRDGVQWQQACEVLHVEKSRLYEMIHEVVDGVDRWRMW